MHTKDYYAILGIDKNASSAKIKSVYRNLALKYHPDRCSEDKKKESEEKFKEIAAAYYVLGDAKRRKEYDDYKEGTYDFKSGKGAGDFASQTGFDYEDLMKHFHNLGARSGRQQGGFNRYFSFDDLGDIFEGLGATQRSYSGAYVDQGAVDDDTTHRYETDVNANLSIPKNIALTGGEIKFKLQDGRTIMLKISPRTKNGQKMRLKGLGTRCPCCDHKGDLTITLRFE